ncbi:uncharacterized protein LOC135487711 [Lineus longissimus]|uniref:uncharacterized protein LOC135487711 n=1 Tax=Lineus longissimus TaxID=88925 RepID=UPI002B4F72AF
MNDSKLESMADLRNGIQGREMQRQVSSLDKEKATYQRQMNNAIQKATQKFKRRLGTLMSSQKRTRSKHARTEERTKEEKDDGEDTKRDNIETDKTRTEPIPQSKRETRANPFFSLPVLLTKPKTQMLLRRRRATTSAVPGQHDSERRLPTLELQGHRNQHLPRREYGPYEGLACLTVVHPITHMVLQNSQVHQTKVSELDAAKRLFSSKTTRQVTEASEHNKKAAILAVLEDKSSISLSNDTIGAPLADPSSTSSRSWAKRRLTMGHIVQRSDIAYKDQSVGPRQEFLVNSQ